MSTENTAPATILSPLEVLTVAPVVLEDGLYSAPTSNDGTKIALQLAKVFYPIRLGVLTVPAKLESILSAAGEDSEELLPITALKASILIRQLTSGVTARDENSNDVLLQVLPSAVRKAESFIGGFEGFVNNLIDNLEGIREQYAGPKAFYAANTTGRKAQVDVATVQTVLLNAVADLNRMAAGYKGYEILALVNYVAKVGSLLNAEQLNIPNVPTKASLLNKLGFRLTPVHAAAHDALVKFISCVEQANNPALDNDTCYDILVAAMNLKRSLDNADALGGGVGGPGSKKMIR